MGACRRADVGRPGFRQQYGRAREAQAEYLVDEIVEIADDGTNGMPPTAMIQHESMAIRPLPSGAMKAHVAFAYRNKAASRHTKWP